MKLLPEIIKNMLKKPVTGKYPLVKPEIPKKLRSKHVYDKKKCIFCGLCARECPAGAIEVDRDKRTYSIDLGKCVFCAQCEEACARINRHAIKMGTEYEMAGPDKKKFVIRY